MKQTSLHSFFSRPPAGGGGSTSAIGRNEAKERNQNAKVNRHLDSFISKSKVGADKACVESPGIQKRTDTGTRFAKDFVFASEDDTKVLDAIEKMQTARGLQHGSKRISTNKDEKAHSGSVLQRSHELANENTASPIHAESQPHLKRWDEVSDDDDEPVIRRKLRKIENEGNGRQNTGTAVNVQRGIESSSSPDSVDEKVAFSKRLSSRQDQISDALYYAELDMMDETEDEAANRPKKVGSKPKAASMQSYDPPRTFNQQKRLEARQKLGGLNAGNSQCEAEALQGEELWSHKNSWSVDIRDANMLRPNEPGYDPGTLFIPRKAMDKLTPFQKQFWSIKKEYYDVIIFFKKGKFYEMYDVDADLCHAKLGLNYTGGGRVDMRCVGVPESASDRHAARLIQLGYSVGRVEQTESAIALKNGTNNVCERALVKVLTRASVTETDFIVPHESRYILCAQEGQNNQVGVCYVDVASCRVFVGGWVDDDRRSQLEQLITLLQPHEVVATPDSESSLNSEFMSQFCSRAILSGGARSGGTEVVTLRDPMVLNSLESLAMSIAEYCDVDIVADKAQASLKRMHQVCASSEVVKLGNRALGAIRWYLSKLKIDKSIFSLGTILAVNIPTVMPANLDAPSSENNSDNAWEALHEWYDSRLILDANCLENLEILRNSENQSETGSLVAFLDRAVTAIGRRMLRKWVAQPLADHRAIQDRLECVDLLRDTDDRSGREFFRETRSALHALPDLERTLIAMHSAAVTKDRAVMFDNSQQRKVFAFLKVLRGLNASLQLIESIQLSISDHNDPKMTENKAKRLQWLLTPGLAVPADLQKVLDHFLSGSVFDVDQAEQEGIMIPLPGVDAELDRAIERPKLIEEQLENILSELKRDLREPNLKWFHRGKEPYQIEVPSSLSKSKCERFLSTCTLMSQGGGANGNKRYWTDEIRQLVNKRAEFLDLAEDIKRESYRQVLIEFDAHFDSWNALATTIAEIDVLIGFAVASQDPKMCRPEILRCDHPSAPFLESKDLYHPILASQNVTRSSFVPNDINLGSSTGVSNSDNKPVMIVSGPNMGGKSTVLRQTCLAAIMAQLGSYVMASEFRLSVVDRIFTRVGAHDRITRGQSTFMIEMEETSLMLNEASKNSLLILDELGRGTSTHDGLAIASAVLDDICSRIKARTLFSTHYHSLVPSNYRNADFSVFQMAAEVDEQAKDVTFLYKLVPGLAPYSRGIYCARIAGIPPALTEEAEKYAQLLENVVNTKVRDCSLMRCLNQIRNCLDSGTSSGLIECQNLVRNVNLQR